MRRDVGQRGNRSDALGRNLIPLAHRLALDAECLRNLGGASGSLSHSRENVIVICHAEHVVSYSFLARKQNFRIGGREGSLILLPMAETIGQRIRQARKARGLSQAKLAVLVGVSRPAVTQWENDDNEPDTANLIAVAEQLDVPYVWLAQGEDQSGVRPMPVLGEVAAGVWREVDGNTYEPIPVAPSPLYPTSAQFALKVVGPSMDKLAPDGDFIHVVDVEKAKMQLRNKDIVVVERRRHGTVEVSVKRYLEEGGKITLRPESTDPRFQEPLEFVAGADDDTQVKVIAIAIGRYSAWKRG